VEDTLVEGRASPIPCAQPVPPFLCKFHACIRSLCHCKQSKHLRKCEECASAISALTPPHSCFLSALMHLIQPAPCPQEITQGPCDVRMPYSSAASCFRGDGLVQGEQRSAWLSKQVPSRCLPRADRLRPTVAIMLSRSSPQ
jgi:hypothetical protein